MARSTQAVAANGVTCLEQLDKEHDTTIDDDDAARRGQAELRSRAKGNRASSPAPPPATSASASAASTRGAKASTAPAAAGDEKTGGISFKVSMKWVSLVLLTVQTSAQALLIRWAQQPVEGEGGQRGASHLSTAVVLLTELVKLIVSLLLVAWEVGGPRSAASAVFSSFTSNRLEALKVVVPSLLYTFQNNLMFFSLTRLSAAVQQVTYQLKILTTALLSVLLLGKVLSPTKWIALFLLLLGVMLVQQPTTTATSSAAAADSLDLAWSWNWEFEAILAFGAVIVACFTSGFASVYLEMILKQTKASIWMRNVQLGAFGSLMALLVALFQDGERIKEDGLFQGFSAKVVCVVLNNALGGLLCAAVLRYADNILRCFSTALSIVLTCLLSAGVMQDYVPDIRFVVGTLFALAATFIYSLGFPSLSFSKRQATTTTTAEAEAQPVGHAAPAR